MTAPSGTSAGGTAALAAAGASPAPAEVGGLQLGFLIAATTAFAACITALLALLDERLGHP